MKDQDRGIIGVLSRDMPDEVSKPTATRRIKDQLDVT